MIKIISKENWEWDGARILPAQNSRKGQNGKVLVIGGSQLFHAPMKWTLEVLSRMADMVFATSTTSNNLRLEQAKGSFWDGIVVPRKELENYLVEAEVILIGPGMERQVPTKTVKSLEEWAVMELKDEDWENNTELVVNHLIAKYQNKKWLLDAGALQMLDSQLLNENCLLTPNTKEWKSLRIALEKKGGFKGGVLLTGQIDQIYYQGELLAEVSGGSSGMTKGGTGDCLAATVAGLWLKLDMVSSMLIGSEIAKVSGELIANDVGPFFNASDLASKIPQTLNSYAEKTFKINR